VSARTLKALPRSAIPNTSPTAMASRLRR
jgi:hypothetical protein